MAHDSLVLWESTDMNAKDSKSEIDCLCVTLNPAIDRTLTVSRFEPGKVNQVIAEDLRPGGKGVNVAHALTGCGFRVAVTGFLGGENAQPFDDLFAKDAIEDWTIRLEGATRVGIKIVDPELNQTTDINFPGLTPPREALDQLVSKLAELTPKWVVLSGSLPPGLPTDIYVSLAAPLAARGIKIAMDTSGEPLRLALRCRPNLLKPNLQELETLAGHAIGSREDAVRYAKKLTAEGTGLVAVSMGAEGAVFVTESDAVFASPPKIKLRTTVGAGDAMVAGLVAASLRGSSLAEAARSATLSSLRAIAAGPLNPSVEQEISVGIL